MSVIQQGTVDWSGENPGIYLKDSGDRHWTTLALYFKVVASPFGRGRGILVLGSPDEAGVFPHAPNVCVADNVPLMQYLLREFVPSFGVFRGLAVLPHIEPRQATGGDTDMSVADAWSETLHCPEAQLRMTWRGLSAPFAADVGPEFSATGRHRMYSVFQGAREAEVAINGQRLAGTPVERDFLGGKLSSAFMAFGESWIEEGKENRS